MNMKKIAVSLFTIFAAVAVVSGGTFALFSDQGTIAGNTISTGTLELTLNHTAGKPFSVTDGYPGWQSDVEWMDIFNSGSLPFEAELSFGNVTGSTDLYDELNIHLWTAGGDSDCATPDFGQNDIYNGSIAVFANGTTVSDIAYWHLANEDDASGPDDNIRAGYSERVCQQIEIDIDAGNDVQGETVTFDEIVDAVQDND